MADSVARTGTNDTTTYKCPNCGAALAYSATSHDVTCEHCGSHFSVEGQKESAASNVSCSAEQMTDAVTYSCQNCGAQLVTIATTAATTCPYCDNNIVLDSRVSGVLKPNGVIPFAFDKSKLADALQTFYADKPLLPKGFFDNNKVEKAQGVYVPFWLYEGTVDGKVVIDAETTSTHISGNYSVTEVKHYKLTRDGSMGFNQVPADGSSRMDNDLMDSVEPFNYDGLTSFDSAYLSGYVADRYDEDAQACYPRAAERMISSTEQAFIQTAAGYEAPRIAEKDLSVIDGKATYVLLPVWLFNTEYEDKKYRYAVNGQTGKVVGELPISKGKSVRAFLLPFFIALVACFFLCAIMGFDGSTASLISLIVGAMVGGLNLSQKRNKMKVVAEATEARSYVKKKLYLSFTNDAFVNTTVTRVPLNNDAHRGEGGPGGGHGGGMGGPGGGGMPRGGGGFGGGPGGFGGGPGGFGGGPGGHGGGMGGHGGGPGRR